MHVQRRVDRWLVLQHDSWLYKAGLVERSEDLHQLQHLDEHDSG